MGARAWTIPKAWRGGARPSRLGQEALLQHWRMGQGQGAEGDMTASCEEHMCWE